MSLFEPARKGAVSMNQAAVSYDELNIDPKP